MYLPPLQPTTNLEIRLCGDVEIDPTASIAPGVILQAAPNSRIIIGVDVCLGMGVIISACGGDVEISNGATLGSGVLVIGRSQIGNNACIGTSTTIINTDVESMKVITPGSIIGEDSLSTKKEIVQNDSEPPVSSPTATQNGSFQPNAIADTSAKPSPQHLNGADVTKSSKGISTPSTNGRIPQKESANKTNLNSGTKSFSYFASSVNSNDPDPWAEKESELQDSTEEVNLEIKGIEKSIETKKGTAIGKVYLDQLLVTLFPHKKQFDKNP